MRLVLDAAKDEVKESLEHFKPEDPESGKKRPIRIDSEFLLKCLQHYFRHLFKCYPSEDLVKTNNKQPLSSRGNFTWIIL